ncbi:50S ribosomal protein L24 [bacterium]|nr:50S ribosomal protein L24 [bacterium]
MVQVIAGDAKGSTGAVIALKRRENGVYVAVDGVASQVRHKKGDRRGAGQIVSSYRFLHESNVRLILDGSPAKVEKVRDGKRVTRRVTVKA